jgi:adenylate kinase
MDLILFGMQGSGKGTQSKFISKACNLAVFETGAELRRLSKEDSDLGRKVKSIIEAGHLVSTEIVMEIIANFIDTLPAGQAALFDGIPRSIEQKENLDKLLEEKGRTFMGLDIRITEEEALKRLTTRRICEGCKATYPAFYKEDACEDCGGSLITRRDDTPDAIRVRLDTFLEKTMPVIDGYNADGKMLVVNGEQAIEAVTEECMKALTPHFPECAA